MTTTGQSAWLTRRAVALGLAGSACVFLRPAFAANVPEAFPHRLVTFVVPFSAGGPVDVLGRVLAQAYQVRSGNPAIVENKTGAQGNIGIDAVRRAKADGTTLLIIPAGNLTINPSLMKNLTFNVERDFAPITLLATAPNVILASNEAGIATVADLIAKAKIKPLTYGSPGVGSQLHLAMELLKDKTGVELQHVPYRGSSQALSDLLGGHIDLVATNLPVVLGAIQAKQVIPIAMTTMERSKLVPDVPTLAESGVEGIDVTSWYGLLAPRATPQPVLDAIFTVTSEIMKTPAVQEKLDAQGLTVVIEPQAPFAERIRRESALWADVVRRHGITVE